MFRGPYGYPENERPNKVPAKSGLSPEQSLTGFEVSGDSQRLLIDRKLGPAAWTLLQAPAISEVIRWVA